MLHTAPQSLRWTASERFQYSRTTVLRRYGFAHEGTYSLAELLFTVWILMYEHIVPVAKEWVRAFSYCGRYVSHMSNTLMLPLLANRFVSIEYAVKCFREAAI